MELLSVQEIKGDALKPQQLFVLFVIHTEHHKRDLQRVGAFLKQRFRTFGDVYAMVARRVVAARAQVIPACRRNFAMSGAAVTVAMTKHSEVSSVVLIVKRSVGTGIRQVQENPYEAGAGQLRNAMQTYFSLLE